MKPVFGVEQHRTEIHQATGQANRSPEKARQRHCAALPQAGRALAATPDEARQHSRGTVLGPGKQRAEKEPGHTEARAVEWHFLMMMSLKQWRKGSERLCSLYPARFFKTYLEKLKSKSQGTLSCAFDGSLPWSQYGEKAAKLLSLKFVVEIAEPCLLSCIWVKTSPLHPLHD